MPNIVFTDTSLIRPVIAESHSQQGLPLVIWLCPGLLRGSNTDPQLEMSTSHFILKKEASIRTQKSGVDNL